MRTARRILVPVDDTAPSGAAFALALDLARQRGASITLLHVYRRPSVSMLETGLGGGQELAFAAASARSTVQAFRDHAKSAGIDVAATTACGEVVDEVVRVATDGEIDLIVMGTHGRTGFRRFLHGSAAEGVVRSASCPVLVVHERRKASVPVTTDRRARRLGPTFEVPAARRGHA